MKRKQVGNGRKSFYSEMQGNNVYGEKICGNPVGLSMYDCPVETVEYIRLNIQSMPGWVIEFCPTVDHSGIQLINQ